MTQDAPGGDAIDPHTAALNRQLTESVGSQRDKDNQLIVPLADWKNWRRVRFRLINHFTGFRYGKDYHALNVAFVNKTPGIEHPTSQKCMRLAEKWARPNVRRYQIRLEPMKERQVTWRGQRLDAKTVDGFVNIGFTSEHFTAAWVGYPAYPGACLIFSVVVLWRDNPELARDVVERWLVDVAPRIHPRTKEAPYRRESLAGR